jgi:hypothetical protein
MKNGIKYGIKYGIKIGIKARAVVLWLAAAAVLALVFSAYLQPSFMLDLGTRFFMCF